VQVSHFTDLKVYQKSAELAGQIFVLSKRWPPEECYSLTDQIWRASRSVGANISEAWGKRRYEAHSVSKLTDAEQKREVGRMLGAILQNPGPFLIG
jgi:four helix bundle protein